VGMCAAYSVQNSSMVTLAPYGAFGIIQTGTCF